jgi:type I restriction enzyme S subunit
LSGAVSSKFLYYVLPSVAKNAVTDTAIKGVTLNKQKLAALVVRLPKGVETQKSIADILETVDDAIEKTESLIAKYQQIKTGLMHDLFTRGVTADGKLRPPREQAPELYHETPLDWIPKEWTIGDLGTVAESLVDGPFGSNLKTEHYVVDPGVRVVRLQNIQATTYNDDDRAYITEKHANFLVRNKVVSGDILIAGLGEERYPVGRACLYPQHLPPAINKADCFRLRCNVDLAINPFVMSYLNTSTARRQIVRYEQGVTRPRINLGNLKKVLLPRPNLNEQEQIWKRLEKAANQIDSLNSVKLKLVKQKSGLMHDLLTGKVRVKGHGQESAIKESRAL